MAKGAAFRPSYNSNRRPSSAQKYEPRRHSIAVPNTNYQGKERRGSTWAYEMKIYSGCISWLVGIWATAVVFISFKDFTFRNDVYPVRLCILFLISATMCILSDLWCFAKLLSICMYVSAIAEKQGNPSAVNWWPDRSPITDEDPENGPRLRNSDSAFQRGFEMGRRMSAPSGRRPSLGEGGRQGERRGSGSAYADHAIMEKAAGGKPNFRYDACILKPSTAAVSLISSESSVNPASILSGPSAPHAVEDSLLPHEFELLWNGLPEQGSFSITTRKSPSQDEIISHLTEQGFKVVMGGDVGRGNIQIMFYAPSFDEISGDDATNARVWFLGMLNIFQGVENLLKLDAEFKCKDSTLIPDFVSKFHFQSLFGDESLHA